MLELSKQIIATKEMYELVKTIIKEQYMPKTLEDFQNSFEQAKFDRVEDPYVITSVAFGYVADKQNYNVRTLTMLFFPYGIGWFRDGYKELLIEDKANTRYLFFIKYQRLLASKCDDLQYFEYLMRKNRYMLDIFDDEVKENKPRFNLFNGKEIKAYKEEMKKQRDELQQKYDEHMEFIQKKIIELTNKIVNKKE